MVDKNVAADLLGAMVLACGAHPRSDEIVIVRRATSGALNHVQAVECGLAFVQHPHGRHAVVYELVGRHGDWQIGRVAYSDPPSGVLPPLIHPGFGATFAATGSPLVVTLEAVLGGSTYRDSQADGDLLLFVPAPLEHAHDASVHVKALGSDGTVVASGSYWMATSPAPEVLRGMTLDFGVSTKQRA